MADTVTVYERAEAFLDTRFGSEEAKAIAYRAIRTDPITSAIYQCAVLAIAELIDEADQRPR